MGEPSLIHLVIDADHDGPYIQAAFHDRGAAEVYAANPRPGAEWYVYDVPLNPPPSVWRRRYDRGFDGSKVFTFGESMSNSLAAPHRYTFGLYQPAWIGSGWTPEDAEAAAREAYAASLQQPAP